MVTGQRLGVPALTLASLAVLAAAPAAAGSYTYTSIAAPGQMSSFADGINASNQVVGGFIDSTGAHHGFVWSGGTFTQVDGTNESSTSNTLLGAINDNGVASGQYFENGNPDEVSFRYTLSTGQQQLVQKTGKNVAQNALNIHGVMVGDAFTAKIDKAFMAKRTAATLLKVPGAKHGSAATSINNSGTIVGSYVDAGQTRHGFSYQSGSYTSFDPPGSVDTTPAFVTDSGVIGGTYVDNTGMSHGFTLSGSTYSVFGYPGAKQNQLWGVGPGGEVIGDWQDTSNAWHGFIESSGTYFSINVSGASSTLIAQVNASGSLSGYYTSGSSTTAFVAICPTGQSPCTQ